VANVIVKCGVCCQTVRVGFLPVFRSAVIPEGVDDGHYDVCAGCGQGVPDDDAEDEQYTRRYTTRLARRRRELAEAASPRQSAVVIAHAPRAEPREINIERSAHAEPSKTFAGRRARR